MPSAPSSPRLPCHPDRFAPPATAPSLLPPLTNKRLHRSAPFCYQHAPFCKTRSPTLTALVRFNLSSALFRQDTPSCPAQADRVVRTIFPSSPCRPQSLLPLPDNRFRSSAPSDLPRRSASRTARRPFIPACRFRSYRLPDRQPGRKERSADRSERMPQWKNRTRHECCTSKPGRNNERPPAARQPAQKI